MASTYRARRQTSGHNLGREPLAARHNQIVRARREFAQAGHATEENRELCERKLDSGENCGSRFTGRDNCLRDITMTRLQNVRSRSEVRPIAVDRLVTECEQGVGHASQR
jgi:hypothetical protein